MAVLFLVALLYALVETTTWKLSTFRRGLAVLRFTREGALSIPAHLVNRQIERDSVIYCFLSERIGLFKKPISGVRKPELSFVLLGEIQLSDSKAYVTARVPLSVILVYVTFLLTAVAADPGGFDFSQILRPSILSRLPIVIAVYGFSLLAFVVARSRFPNAFEVVVRNLQTFGAITQNNG